MRNGFYSSPQDAHGGVFWGEGRGGILHLTARREGQGVVKRTNRINRTDKTNGINGTNKTNGINGIYGIYRSYKSSILPGLVFLRGMHRPASPKKMTRSRKPAPGRGLRAGAIRSRERRVRSGLRGTGIRRV